MDMSTRAWMVLQHATSEVIMREIQAFEHRLDVVAWILISLFACITLCVLVWLYFAYRTPEIKIVKVLEKEAKKK